MAPPLPRERLVGGRAQSVLEQRQGMYLCVCTGGRHGVLWKGHGESRGDAQDWPERITLGEGRVASPH